MIVTLYAARSRVPDLDCAVFRACDHPFSFAMEGYACDVARVAIKGQERIGVRRAAIVKLDIVVASSSEKALVRRNAQAVDLRVRMLYGARADAGQCFPKTNRVVVASCNALVRWAKAFCAV